MEDRLYLTSTAVNKRHSLSFPSFVPLLGCATRHHMYSTNILGAIFGWGGRHEASESVRRLARDLEGQDGTLIFDLPTRDIKDDLAYWKHIKQAADIVHMQRHNAFTSSVTASVFFILLLPLFVVELHRGHFVDMTQVLLVNIPSFVIGILIAGFTIAYRKRKEATKTWQAIRSLPREETLTYTRDLFNEHGRELNYKELDTLVCTDWKVYIQ